LKGIKLIVSASSFLVLLYNLAFFRNFVGAYPLSYINAAYLLSVVILQVSILVILFSFVLTKYTAKPLLIAIFMVSSISAYFMDTYNVIIDMEMINNILATDSAESKDLLNFRLLLYFFILGVLPSICIYKLEIAYGTFWGESIAKLKLIVIGILLIVATIFLFGDFYASFFREHKILRYYTNPITYIYSSVKYLTHEFIKQSEDFSQLGEDAKRPQDDAHRELVVMVVGESARADRFSLNGYLRNTNPLLGKENVLSYTNFSSCGTSTAVSVPCIFSADGRSEYSDNKSKNTENLLDVLVHAGVHVLWRDNNSSSKGVANRIPYENYKTNNVNPVCDTECRDEGMLFGLQDYIDQQTESDILIVLHQMGNHGPAYYKRYPEAFERFKPVCRTNQLNQCTREEINNGYDNAILYTDYFLSKVIGLLKENSDGFETAMIYVSDHGESLGEKGLYLHGLPYFAAPETQTHIPAIFWFGENNDDIDHNALRKKRSFPYSHDNIFHTIIGIMELKTSVYDRKMDILQGSE